MNPKFIPSRTVFVTPELRLDIISAGRLILIPILPAASASIPINIKKIGMANMRDVTKKLIFMEYYLHES